MMSNRLLTNSLIEMIQEEIDKGFFWINGLSLKERSQDSKNFYDTIKKLANEGYLKFYWTAMCDKCGVYQEFGELEYADKKFNCPDDDNVIHLDSGLYQFNIYPNLSKFDLKKFKKKTNQTLDYLQKIFA